jgi:hypothetical protein
MYSQGEALKRIFNFCQRQGKFVPKIPKYLTNLHSGVIYAGESSLFSYDIQYGFFSPRSRKW